MNKGFGTSLAFMVFLLLLGASHVASDVHAADPDTVITAFGTPDTIGSTEYDKPRPLMVMKWFIYKKENVRIIFMADAPLGSPPPYKVWKLINVMDAPGKKELEPEEYRKRMSKRVQK